MSRVVPLLIISFCIGQGICNKECWDGCSAAVYSGTLSVTVNGKTCQTWTDKVPHNHTLDKDELFPYDGSASAALNYCRDPRDYGQPWCFTTDPLVPYEFCDVPICEYTCCTDKSNTALYTGKLSLTQSGEQCQPWVDQKSFQLDYSNDSLFLNDGTAVEAGNYCRDPDQSGVIWCYTLSDLDRRDKCEPPKCNKFSVICGGILTGPKGWISPLFVSSQIDLSCHWTVIVDVDHVVNLVIEEINLFRSLNGFCLRSRIRLYDGMTNESPWMHTQCGTAEERIMATSSSNAMFIYFNGVDDEISFNVSYFQSAAVDPCDQVLTESTGWFSPPDIDEDGRFENNLDCWWVIVADDGLVAQLAVLDMFVYHYKHVQEFSFMYMQFFTQCGDYIKIYEGVEYNLLGKYCLTEAPPFITSRSRQLAVYFYSDYIWTSDGFVAIYSASLNRTEYFWGQLNGESGLFGSSNYRLFSDWTITARDGYVLQLFMVTMDMDGDTPCQEEKLEIFDGASWWDKLIGIYCGHIPPPTITATSQNLLILYSTEIMFEVDIIRFLGMYRTYPNPEGTLGHMWPKGNYALPTTIYGCNDPEFHQWQRGYINISFVDPVLLFERSKGHIDMETPSLLLGPYGSRSLQLNFCVKVLEEADSHTQVATEWPPGQYAVYGSEKGCPRGLEGKIVSRSMPAIMHVNKDGYLPKLNIVKNGLENRIEFYLCYKNDGISSANFDYLFPFSVLSFDQDKNKTEKNIDSADFLHEEHFLLSTDKIGNQHQYSWLHYYISIPERLKDNFATKRVRGEKLMPWELGFPDEYFIHEQIQQSAFGRMLTTSESELDSEWLLYDLGQSVSITSIRLIKVQQLSFLDGQHLVLPDILISHMKWSFLSSGATHCLQSAYRLKHIIEISCLNGQPGSTGRYLVLYLRQPATINILRRILTQHWRIQIVFAEKSPRCSQLLGMNDWSIADFQLSASSEFKNHKAKTARPYGTGWCMQPDDEDPFLQVDLLVPTLVEGITIYNWWELYNQTYMPVLSSEARGMGVYKFSVEFIQQNAIDSDSEIKTYSLDMSRPYDSGQTFLFVTPGTTRYLKIRPLDAVDARGLKCLRFELIGCPRLERLTNECGDRGTGDWFMTNNVLIPGGDVEPTVLRNMSSVRDCAQECQEWSKYCFVIVYDDEENNCVWYDESRSNYYKELTADANQTFLSRMCSADTASKEYTATSYVQDGSSIKNLTTIEDNGIAVSFGYPFHYIKGYVWSWEFTSNDPGFISIIFTDVSLNIYEDDTFIDVDKRRYSDKIDRLYVLDIAFEDYFIYTDQLLSEQFAPVCVLDAENNDRIAYCRSVFSDLRIIFRTWAIESPIKHHGRGFRARYYVNDVTFCPKEQDNWIVCDDENSYLASGLYLGEETQYEQTFWDIFPKGITARTQYAYIELTFKEFDIGCSQGSTLKISHLTTNEEIICNLNRPVGTMTSYGIRVKIQFRSSMRYNILREGFLMSYHKVDIPKISTSEEWRARANRNISWLGDIILTKHYSPHFGVCSNVYKKCYIHFIFEFISWEAFEYLACELNGLSMVSLQSREEQRLVGDLVLRKDTDFFYSLTKPSSLYAFIGLRRFGREDGKLTYEWSNRARGNRAVTFTAWGEGEPSPSSETSCVLMNLKLSQNHTWKSIACDELTMAPFGICELPFETDDKDGNQVNVTDYLTNEEKQVPILSELNDSSIYFHCEGEEIISILALCDGIRDCFYGDDEINCQQDRENCTEGEFRCDDGTCVKMTVLCDHFVDCPDASDENCYFLPCLEGEFRCNEGSCIEVNKRCDTKNDCVDGSDEMNCEESICSNWRSLMCDSKCIANSSICDGVKDCLDGKDEENCTVPNSCLEWWTAGYTTSGFYTIHGTNVECDFTKIVDGIILSRYHAIDYERTINENFAEFRSNDFIYEDERVIQKLMDEPGELAVSHICYQSVDVLCSPYKQLLFSLNELPECQCKRYFKPFLQEKHYISECYETLTESHYSHESIALLTKVDLQFVYGEDVIQKFRILDPQKFLTENNRFIVRPIECLTQTPNSSNDLSFPCGQGLTTTAALRCIYDRDKFGNIKGCRSLDHLQDCESFACPAGYYKCHKSFCLERKFICDGEVQCAGGDDEQHCDYLLCRRQYRCLNSTVCLSAPQLCDGYRHCPRGDDERLCDFRNRCPEFCSCVGATMYCHNTNSQQNTSYTSGSNNSTILPSASRVIDISSNLDFFHSINWELQSLHFLAHLNLSHCNISDIPTSLFQHMYNLQSLDLSYNLISVLSSLVFRDLHYLRLIRLDGNLEVISFESDALVGLLSLKVLDLQSLLIGNIPENSFSSLNLEVLDFSSSKIERIEGMAFQGMSVEKFFLSGSEIHWFSNDMFKGIDSIGLLVTDAYKFCCIKPTYLPSTNCFPQKEIFSSCSDLIGNEVMRPLMWVVCLVGLISNISTFIYRVYFALHVPGTRFKLTLRVNLKRVFGLCVANLAISDLLTCLSLLIILSYDSLIRGSYSFADEYWRSSVWCQFARVLSTVSCQISVALLCIISVDRLLVIKYPYGQVRLQPKLTVYFLALLWLITTLFAAFPVVDKAFSGKDFSSKTSICLPSVLSIDAPPSWTPSVAFIIVGCILLLFTVAYGVYISQKEMTSLRKALAGKIVSRTNDLKISRNLMLLEIINILLYLPIGITGFLILQNQMISESFYIWTSQLIFPITSAINPVLYTLLTIIQKRTFQPDSEEQDRLEFYTKDKLETALTIWNNRRFLKPRSYSEKFVSLQDVLDYKLPSRHCCIKIVIYSLCCLKDLHDRDMIQDNFSVRDIRLRNLDTSFMTVLLECRPKFAKKESEKAVNMESFGQLVRSLFQLPQSFHRKNMSYKSDKFQRFSSKSKSESSRRFRSKSESQKSQKTTK